ncbi:MAG: hypothetical protein JXD23_05125 [Spirochaetales bacterium]|nr:hypothetical protein [Spirochaetales bacterium]
MIGALFRAHITPNLTKNPAVATKISVPVRPLILPNMVFKHVLAVPARAGEETTPAYQVQLLEDLITQLTGESGNYSAPPQKRTETGDALRARVVRIGERLQAAARSLKAFSAGMLPAAGTLLNRLA